MGIITLQIFSPASWYLIYDYKCFEYFVKICSISIYKTDRNFVPYFKTNFSLIEDYWLNF